MDSTLVNTAELEASIVEKWLSFQQNERDPKINWDLAWGEVETILQQEKKKQANLWRRWELGDKLQNLRIAVETDHSPEAVEALSKAEQEARHKVMQDTIRLRLRSRIRWLRQGDAPTKYFFLQLRAKQARESIKCLELANGESTEDENRIVQKIFKLYTNLFRSDPKVVGRTQERKEVLRLITTKISHADNLVMIEPPTDREIERIVQDLKKEKSPGIDGVTAEMLQKFWPCMRTACFELVRAFWHDVVLTTRVLAGIIKLIPKNQQIIFLLNWHPLTMLTLTEKLCVKLVANRIKGPTGKIIDEQQTGFLEGRNITDNLLTIGLHRNL